jgi:Ser-tRNA(Ala) deacylase AlaX
MLPNLMARIYLRSPYVYSYTTTVLRLSEDSVVLAETIFHPQGGGQPADIGFLLKDSNRVFEI